MAYCSDILNVNCRSTVNSVIYPSAYLTYSYRREVETK